VTALRTRLRRKHWVSLPVVAYLGAVVQTG